MMHHRGRRLWRGDSADGHSPKSNKQPLHSSLPQIAHNPRFKLISCPNEVISRLSNEYPRN
jgi:hypothetical protein